MINKEIRKFSEFLDYYKPRYTKPSWEISLPHLNDNNKNPHPLVKSDYPMLDFDEICKDANFYPKRNKEECNRPSTVDALYYRILNTNRLELMLVEFKNFYFDWDSTMDYIVSLRKVKQMMSQNKLKYPAKKGLERLENIENTYGSTIEFSLRLKPYESLFVVLPKVYDEYCMEKEINEKDRINLYNFFQSDICEIKLFIVGKKQNENLHKAYNGKLGALLDKQYKRLDFVNILKYHPQRLCFESEFDEYTNNLKLHEKESLKSLNYP